MNTNEQNISTKQPENDGKQDSKKGKNKFEFWSTADRIEKIQIFLALLNLFTLIAFIIVSSVQISHSSKALDYADSTNVHTRKSIELGQQTAHASDSSNQKSLTIAMGSLDATRESNVLTEKIAKMDLRAYISVIDMSFEKIKVGEKLCSNMNLKNVGKTPAYKIKVDIGFKIGGTGVYDIEMQNLIRSHEEHILTSGVIMNISGETDYMWIKDDSTKVINGGKPCFIYGKITYFDIFKVEHHTNFCFSYTVPRGFTVYNKYNDGD